LNSFTGIELKVDPVALHIHERISAQAILRVAAREDVQRDLFADPQQSYHEAVQFYQHDIDWTNRMILGDSLQVMASLARREDLAGKVQMIYLDPPYGIKFASNFQPEIGKRDVKDKEQDLTREPEMVKAYRDTWQLGIHSYLSYLRDRLIVAKELLADSGSIFVQISDENLHRIRALLDEVFGVENYVSVINCTKTSGQTAKYLSVNTDYILWYARDFDLLKYHFVLLTKSLGSDGSGMYQYVELEDGIRRRLTADETSNPKLLPTPARVYRLGDISSQRQGRASGPGSAMHFPVRVEGVSFIPPGTRGWSTTQEGMKRLAAAGRLLGQGERLSYMRYLEDFPALDLGNNWTDVAGVSDRVYVVQTNEKMITRCLLMTTDPGDLVLDPTCGSGTTAYVAEQWGRRWITCDTSRVALAIARQRLLTAKFDYFKLKEHAQDERATSEGDTGILPVSAPLQIRQGAYLPHWTRKGATYAVTFRLGDSLPGHVLEAWRQERQAIVKTAEQMKRPLSEHEEKRLAELFSEKVEQHLDAGAGACWLKRDDLAQLVADALKFFDGNRYELIAWCVMPNHVHVVVKPLGDHTLPEILHSWKSFTANKANKLLGRTGEFWQPEYYDHLIRDAEDFDHAVEYVLRNPENAGLKEWKWVGHKWEVGKSGTDTLPVPAAQPAHAQDERATAPANGFVYKTVPHITLKSIAQNTNLDPILAKHEPILEEKLAACNAALRLVSNELRAKLQSKLLAKQKAESKKAITDADRRRWELPKTGEQWQHWQVPFDTDSDYPKELADAVTAYRQAWRAKMDEVNGCIAANAEQEELVDQPEVVKGIVRVSGPFTVEAVQPPEMSLGDAIEMEFGGEPEELAETFDVGDAVPPVRVAMVETRVEQEAQNLDAYLDQMLRLLRTDGVRFPNNKQMSFTRLEMLSGNTGFLHAEGRWVPAGETNGDADGRANVCVTFGPQYGPVTSMQVVEAARSAIRNAYDELVIAGFSFDAAAQSEIEEYRGSKLRVHLAHIRPDVNPGMNGLLKEQPGSQLFTVFGQPRTRLEGPNTDGEYTVVMEGVDIYDPVDNSITPTGADKVAAWFVDGDYDGRTFCITQAFFPDRSAWEKLSKALTGVVDAERFAAFSGTVSLPFPPGKHKCVAVKVIDPRGNEVMTIHRLR